MRRIGGGLSLMGALLLGACGDAGTAAAPSSTASAGRSCTPLTIVRGKGDLPFNVFDRKVAVFSMQVWAAPGVMDRMLLHAAGVLAQYLDNNGDGVVDDPGVAAALAATPSRPPAMAMFATAGTLDEEWFRTREGYGQPLYQDEVYVNGHALGIFDYALEETLHAIYDNGWAVAYPTVFGATTGSRLAAALNEAKTGGWYTHNGGVATDNQDLESEISEYYYWIASTLLGAQEMPGRADIIAAEWSLTTPALVQAGNPTAWALLHDPAYRFPSILPDGSYCP